MCLQGELPVLQGGGRPVEEQCAPQPQHEPPLQVGNSPRCCCLQCINRRKWSRVE